MGKCKTKAIQTDLGTFRHNQAYSKPFVSLAYSEPWYIQNPDIFKTRNIFRTPVHWRLWHIQSPRLIQTSAMKRFVKTVNGKKFCNISLRRSLLHGINILRWLLQRFFFYVKKTLRTSVPGTVKFWYTY